MRTLFTRGMFLLGCLLAACQAAPVQPAAGPSGLPTSSTAPETVRALYTEITENRIPLWLGVDRQLFDQAGVHVESTFVAGTPNALAAMLSGEADVLEASAGDFVSSFSKGADLKAIGVVGETTAYQLYVKPDIQTPQDLAGKRVAISKLGSNSYLFVRSMLDAMHAPDTVTLVPSGDFNANFAAFVSGSVEGYATTPVNRIGQDPNSAHPLGDPAALGVTASGHFLVVRSDYLQGHRNALVRFLKGYTVATGYAFAHDDASEQSFATHMQKTDPELLKGLVAAYVHYPAREGGMPLDPTPTVELMQRQIGLQAKLDTSVDPQTVDGASMIDASLMEEVKASSAWREAWPQGVPPH